MTQVGGPAAINGFLYQIIHHIGWLAGVTLSGQLIGEEVEDACLVLEPRNGGDARAEASGLYLVEQYKTKSDGTWSLADIESVLCDLRKAVPPTQSVSACYRFVTNGREGRLDTFRAFLADVRAAAGPAELDNMEKRSFRNKVHATNREYFDHVAAETKSATHRSTIEGSEAVYHLLSNFEMEFDADSDAHAAVIERHLRRYAPDLGDEGKIREHLVGVLLEKLSKGETRLDAEGINSIFRHVGLSPERLRKVASLSETMNALTQRRLMRLKYQHGHDVRSVPEWPEDKPVLLIAGENGAGKTWQLGRLLEACGQERQVATLVTSANSTEELLSRAARDLWQAGLGETSEKTLVAVSHFLRELLPNADAPRMIIALDDVQGVDMVRDLVRQDWGDWGMRLALTVPSTVARAIQQTDDGTVHVHTVGDFSIDELDALLSQSGQRWTDLPADLKMILRHPILAGIFLELPYTSIQSAPNSEYEIFAGHWGRITEKGHPGDAGLLIALANATREGKPYPLPRQMWHEIGLDSGETLARIERCGWLRSTEDGEVAFAHERLLNWAVAKALAQQYLRGQLSDEKLGACLGGEGDDGGRRVRARLGYVPMDVLWLLARDPQNTQNLARLVGHLEDSQNYGGTGEELYVHLLPTLGQSAVPILMERLKVITANSEGDYRARLIGKAFAALAKQDSVDMGEETGALLSAPDRDRQNVAIAALTEAPDARHLDRLWELHQQRFDALQDKENSTSHIDYTACFAALRAAVARTPEWLRHRIIEADGEKERVSELGFLLNGLEHPEALAIWKETRDVLIKKVDANKPRSLLYCIARFADREQMGFVIEHISHEKDFGSSAALAALAVLDPEMALDRLFEVNQSTLYLTRNQWLPMLLRALPDQTRERIRDRVNAEPDGRRIVVDLFGERPDEMDASMLHDMLRALEKELHGHLDDTLRGEPHWLDNPLKLLGRIARLDLLAVLEAEAGGELERMITKVACSRLRTNSNCRDYVRESARRVLILMCGEGITEMIRQEVESEHIWVRHGGLNWAYIREDVGVIERLAAIAGRPVPRDAGGKPETELYQEFILSMNALAALGADTELVNSIWSSGMAEVPVALAHLREHRGPMPQALTGQALEILQSTEQSEEALQRALVIAWLSDDIAMTPAVRAVLKRANPDSRVAAYACIALQSLGDDTEEFVQLARDLLYTKENYTWGLEALLRLGERGAEILENWLVNRYAESRADQDEHMIRLLYANQATRKQSVAIAVDRCTRGESLFGCPYDIAAEADAPALREQIFDKAFAARTFVTTQLLHAIEGLAKFDVSRAVEAIELGLKHHPKIERQLCWQLVRFAPEVATLKLIGAAVSIERSTMPRSVGQALRRLEPDVVSMGIVERMQGQTVPERKVAAEVAGWVPTSTVGKALGDLADHDPSMEVRCAAITALERHRRETNVRQLIEAFPSAKPEQQWSLLIAILDAADPYLLTDHEDPLWLGTILSEGVPAAFSHHANSVLRQRKQKEQ